MESALISPAAATVAGIPTIIFSILIAVVGVAIFVYMIFRRIQPLVKAVPDERFCCIGQRIGLTLKIWLAQWRQPRYLLAGIIHIFIFAGFIILGARSTQLVILGFSENFVLPGFSGFFGQVYNVLKDYAATWVLIACVVAAVRRGIFTPDRYAVPPRYGKDHTAEAVFVLGLISTLMISESVFEGSRVTAEIQNGLHAEIPAPLSLAWFLSHVLSGASQTTLQNTHLIAYIIHDLTFFFFLCFLPLGKHFHVITSIFNVFFMRVEKGNVKPVRYGIADEQLDELDSFGVKVFEDFTWKHMLDFYSCADCGRCSDRCPANAVGRPLSPRFISIKGRDYAFNHYPLIGGNGAEVKPLIGDIYDEDEIWSCTTCGACEQECPLGIEYIDKIVDLRRGMVDDGLVPQSLQKPLSSLEKRGNPWGKMERKRADWTKSLPEDIGVKIIEKGAKAETLYFVDSISSFDDRMQEISRCTAQILNAAGIDFGILGKVEKDSGHEARRFGEEMLYQDLRDQNTEAILNAGVQRIVTADPHASNALKKDYSGLPALEHISQTIARQVQSGKIQLTAVEDPAKIYVYHDACYLGRHNDVYDAPRLAIDSIPGIRRVEMTGNCRDRSFCCGGGGLMLFYEPEEEQRMGVLRVEMAQKSGAGVIVTACPFCLVNIEDAIKVSGLEGRMEAVDLTELISRHLVASDRGQRFENEYLPFEPKSKNGFEFKPYLEQIKVRLENLYNASAFDIKAYAERITGGKIGYSSYEIVKGSRIFASSLRYYPLPKGINSNGKILYLPSPLVNRPEIYDLAKDKSVIEGMHKAGFTVYLVDNGDPGYEESKLGLDYYGKTLHDKYLEIISRRHPGQDIQIMAYCMGGTLIMPYLARRAEERLARGETMDIHKVVLMASPVKVDDADSGYAPVRDIIRKGYNARLMKDLFGDVNIPIQVIESGMNQTQLGVQYHVASGFYNRAISAEAIDDSAAFFYWLSHGRMFPAQAHREWIQRVFIENQIYQGEFCLSSTEPTLDGKPVDMRVLKKAEVAILDYRGTRDMISPAGSCVASETWGQTDGGNRTVEKNIGHIFVVSKKFLTEFLNTVTGFLLNAKTSKRPPKKPSKRRPKSTRT